MNLAISNKFTYVLLTILESKAVNIQKDTYTKLLITVLPVKAKKTKTKTKTTTTTKT